METVLTLPGLEGAVFSRPHKGDAGGGDVHLVSSCGTGRITRLLLADIAGHGEGVSELGRRLRLAMQRYMNHISPQALASRMNHDMNELTPDSGTFATAIILTFFAPDGGLSLCNAGHPPPMLYRGRKRRWRAVDQPDPVGGEGGEGGGGDVNNLPLGILEEVGYTGRDLTLHPGDLLFAYTDCLNEATHADGHDLGTAGLLDALGRVRDPDPASLTPALLADLSERGYGLDDDLTTVTLRCSGRSEGAGVLDKVTATARTFRDVAIGERPFPWPELSWLNLGGAVLPGVKRKRGPGSSRRGEPSRDA